jgi:hypothetical protein
MGQQIAIKQGGSLNLLLLFADEGGPIDISQLTITAQVRSALNVVVATPDVTQPGQLGAAAIAVYDTSSWPLGYLRCDLRVVGPSAVLFSDTFSIHVGRSVTQP